VYATCSILPSENQEQVQLLTTELVNNSILLKIKRFWLRKVVLMDSIWLCSRERIVKIQLEKIIPIDNIKKPIFNMN
jgi:3-oxoacyl-ACP reductase-like protein